MDREEFDFDPEKLRIPEFEASAARVKAEIDARRRNGGGMPPELEAKLAAHKAKGGAGKRLKKPRDSKNYFVRFPMIWVEELAKIRAGANTYRVALGLVFECWSNSYDPVVKFTNGLLAKMGVDRKGKAAALKQLVAAKLISVEWRDKKSPLVTLRFVSA